MRRRNRLKFKSNRSSRNIKKIAIRISSALLCVAVGFFTAMITLPLFENKLPEQNGSSEAPSSLPESSVVSSEPEVEIIFDKGIRAVYIPPSALDTNEEQNSYHSLLRNSGINAVIFDIKDESGVLYYPSQIEMVTKVGNVSDISVNYRHTVKKFKDAGFYVIGRMVCFKDNTMPRNKVNYRPYSVLTDSRVNWYYNNIFWLDPYKETARDYLYSIVSESLELGFNEIMLDEVKFPDSGPTYMLDYGEQALSRSEILTEFINRCAELAHGKNAKLSLKTSWKFVEGTATEESGQNFSLGELDIDCYLPDFRITEVARSNKSMVIGEQTVATPYKNPVSLISALDTLLNKKAVDGIVFRPYISASSPAGYTYSSDEIKGQALVFGGNDEYNFVYFEKSGSYSPDITETK